MIKDRNYIQGTAARKLEYDVYEENKVLSEKKKQRVSNKIKIKVVFAFIILFTLSALVVYRYALITDLSYKIDAKKNEYTEIKNDNTRLKVQIASNLDIQRIQRIAEENLGMKKPDKSQYTNVIIPRSDFTTASNEINGEGKNNKSIFDTLLSRVDKFTRLLY